MSNSNRALFQAHPFHLVSPSPWPIYTCVSLLTLTTTTALSMHGFYNAHYFLAVALLTLISSMAFWFRDIISEGTLIVIYVILTSYYLVRRALLFIHSERSSLNTAKAISPEEIKQALNDFNKNTNYSSTYVKNNLGHYLAGLLELKKLILYGFYTIRLYSFIAVFRVRIRKKSSYIPNSTYKDLVIWGVNLNSGFTTKNLTNVELNMFKLPQYQCSIIVGLLLSDGWLSYASANH